MNAPIPTGGDVPTGVDYPVVSDDSGNYYAEGLEMEYQSGWSSGVTVEIEVPAEWTIEGWTRISESPLVYSKLIPYAQLTNVATAQDPYADFNFTFVGPETGSDRRRIRHDPKIRITPPQSY